jgi:hypothetical protein
MILMPVSLRHGLLDGDARSQENRMRGLNTAFPSVHSCGSLFRVVRIGMVAIRRKRAPSAQFKPVRSNHPLFTAARVRLVRMKFHSYRFRRAGMKKYSIAIATRASPLQDSRADAIANAQRRRARRWRRRTDI